MGEERGGVRSDSRVEAKGKSRGRMKRFDELEVLLRL